MLGNLLLPHYRCAFCKSLCPGEPEYCIHRDGEREGPQVPLCNTCGENERLSCQTIWDRISTHDGPDRTLN